MLCIYLFICYLTIATQALSTADIEKSNEDLLERRILSNKARNTLIELQKEMKGELRVESRREKLLAETNKQPRIRSLRTFATQKVESSKRKRTKAELPKKMENEVEPFKPVPDQNQVEFEDRMSELRMEYNRLKKKVLEKLRTERKRHPSRMAVERNNQELYQSMKVSIDPKFIDLDDFQQFNDISDSQKEEEAQSENEESGFKEINNENIVDNTLFQDELRAIEAKSRVTNPVSGNTVAKRIDSTRLKITSDIEDITKNTEEETPETNTVILLNNEDSENMVVSNDQEMGPATNKARPEQPPEAVRAMAIPIQKAQPLPENSPFLTEIPPTKEVNQRNGPATNTVTLLQVDNEAQPRYFYDARKVPTTPTTRQPSWKSRVSTIDSETAILVNTKKDVKVSETESIRPTVTSTTPQTTTVTQTEPATEEPKTTTMRVVDITALPSKEIVADQVQEKDIETVQVIPIPTEPPTPSTSAVYQILRIQPIITSTEPTIETTVTTTMTERPEPSTVVFPKLPEFGDVPDIIIRRHLTTTTPLSFVTDANEEQALNELELFSNQLNLINGARELRSQNTPNTTDWTLEQVERELEDKKRALAELEKLHEYVSQRKKQQKVPKRPHTVPQQPIRARGSKIQPHAEEIPQSTETPDILELQNALNEIKFFERSLSTTPVPINIVNWKEQMLSQNTIFPSLSSKKKKYQSTSKIIKEKKVHKKKRRYSGSSGSAEKNTKRAIHKKGMVESVHSLLSMLEAENRSIRSAETQLCKRITCNFETGDFCEFESSFDEITRKKSKRTKRQSEEPFYVMRSWSNWVGLPYESNLRIDKSPFFDSRNSRFAGVFLEPREVATLSFKTNFSQSFSITLALYEATRGVRLRICCDEECPFSTEYGILRGHKKWLQRNISCPAKTKNVIIECVNSSDKFRGSCGIDDLTLIKPQCSNEFKA